jgi:DNA-binding LytR/AlgR family response regulator
MSHKYLVADDEPLARKLILSHVSKVEGLECAGECNNALDAGHILRTRKIDLVFLDIEMPELNGMELIKTLKNPPLIIFTTAYRDFAPEAFEIDAIDYLVKPISFERLIQAINKFFDRVPTRQSIQSFNNLGESKSVFIKSERKMHKIFLEDIQYIESLDDFVKVYLKGRVLISRENISTLESKLPKEMFIRIHRSFIVSMLHLNSVSADGVDINGKILPFGRAFKMGAMSALGIRLS